MSAVKATVAGKPGVKRRIKTNLTAKASYNAIAAVLDFAARAIVGLLLNPLLLGGLNSYGYGLWQILGRLVGFISPATGRPTQALKWTIAHKQSSRDYEDKRRDVGSTVAVWVLFLPLLATIGGGVAWFAPHWLKVPAEQADNVRLVAALLVVNLILSSLVEVPRSVLAGENLSYKRMGLSTFLVFVGGGLMALAVYLHTGLIGVAAALIASTCLTGLLFLVISSAYVPWFGIALPNWARIKRFAQLSGWFLAWNLVMRLMKAGDIVLLGIFASVELVTVYTLTKYLPEIMIDVVEVIVSGTTPGLGGIMGSGDLAKAARIRSEIMNLSWLVFTVAGATVLLWNHAFIRLWVGHAYDAGPLATLLVTVMATQFILIRNDANIIDLGLNLRGKVMLGLFSVSLSLGVAWVLVGVFKLEIIGLCAGFIAGRTVISLSYPWLVGRLLHISFAAQIRGALRPCLVTLLLLAPTPIMGHFITPTTWLSLIAFGAASVSVIIPFAFFAGLARPQRKSILHRFTLIMRPVAAR
ncbi:MAG: oligosaccharide flippase family protein [Gammaproteobacteria bacterium]